MSLLDQYYEITQTKPSDYTQRQLTVIEESVSTAEERYIASLAHFLLHTLAFGHEGNRKLVIKFNKLLKRLADDGIARYQVELASDILEGHIAPPAGEGRALAAMKLYQKAYEQGSGGAAGAIAYMYEVKHKGIELDAEKAAFYRRESERLGDDEI